MFFTPSTARQFRADGYCAAAWNANTCSENDLIPGRPGRKKWLPKATSALVDTSHQQKASVWAAKNSRHTP